MTIFMIIIYLLGVFSAGEEAASYSLCWMEKDRRKGYVEQFQPAPLVLLEHSSLSPIRRCVGIYAS